MAGSVLPSLGDRTFILDSRLFSGSGFGMLYFDTSQLTITFESGPTHDAESPLSKHRQHPGWPHTIGICDNFERKPFRYLPELNLAGFDRSAISLLPVRFCSK